MKKLFYIWCLILPFTSFAKDGVNCAKDLPAMSQSKLHSEKIRIKTNITGSCIGSGVIMGMDLVGKTLWEIVPVISSGRGSYSVYNRAYKHAEELKMNKPYDISNSNDRFQISVLNVFGDILGAGINDMIVGPIQYVSDWLDDGEVQDFQFMRSRQNSFPEVRLKYLDDKNKLFKDPAEFCGKWLNELQCLAEESEKRSKNQAAIVSGEMQTKETFNYHYLYLTKENNTTAE